MATLTTMDSQLLQTIVVVAMRYIHIVSAIVAVGGMAFMLLCVSPAVRLLDDQFRDSLLKLVHHRFLRVLWACIALLVISGVYNWIMVAPVYHEVNKHRASHLTDALIGTKVLLALIMFAIVGARSLGMMNNARRALMINIHLAAAVILLASLLRHVRLEYLQSLIPH